TEFASAVADILDQADYPVAVQVIRALATRTDIACPTAIIDALVRRALRTNTSLEAETDALDVLALLDPARFTEEFHSGRCPDWRRRLQRILAAVALRPRSSRP